ncbi:MAG: type II toxin-antitoxin system RelE/ParE family toxin [bacterium]
MAVRGGRVRKAEQAKLDIVDLAFFLVLESGQDELGVRFLDAAESAFESLARMPEMGVRRLYLSSTLTDLRIWRVPGFPNHLVFYRAHDAGVEIIRVIHAKRDIEVLLGDE